MAWAALAGLAMQGSGTYAGSEAAKGDAAHQGALAKNYQDAYNQYANWQNRGSKTLYQKQHDLAMQGYANQNQLAQALGSSERYGAYAGAQAQERGQLGQALGLAQQGVTPANRSYLGNQGVGQQWGGQAFQQRYAPALGARSDMLAQMAGQRGMSAYDARAQGQAGDTMVDLGRQSAEAQQRENALSAYRQQLLEQAAVNYQYKGPGAGYYNAQLYGGAANAAGAGLMAYSANQRSSPYATQAPASTAYGQQPASGASSGSGSYGW